MDYDNDKKPWDWQKEDHCLQKASNMSMSQELWNEVPQNEEDLSYMFDDETTPVKACGDLAYHVNNNDNSQSELEECRVTSQVKRRRMLQFSSEDGDLSMSCDDMSSEYLKLNGKDSMKDVFFEVSQLISSGNTSGSSCDDLEHSAEGWLAQCFNDAEMDFSPDDIMNLSEQDKINVSDLCDVSPAFEQNVVQQRVTGTPKNIIFKGRKSFIRAPTKLASSVAYPFAFIKPSGAHGDVTLKEINQRIQTPPPSKPKRSSEEDPSAYPKSAFSGKPVVGKTKIRTEGGKGSITIMRTKG
ncbi:protein XRI1-like [Prosopis cineraria]|uniref:protein XRI1-like n=1 Tax=Prosopis cineraria TaxID=364024 RepID=UPI002410229E|nr:protein XRI1-like [Prosopis cineraria]